MKVNDKIVCFGSQQQPINPYHTYRVDSQYHSPQPQPQPRLQQPPQSNQFYLHENTAPQPPARRTWAQSPNSGGDLHHKQQQQQQQSQPQSQMLPLDINAWSQNSPKADTHTWKSTNQSNSKNSGFMLHQNNGVQQSSQMEQFYSSPVSSSGSESRANLMHHNTNGANNDYRDNRIPISSPPIDDMAPQSISFIGDDDLITEHPRKSCDSHKEINERNESIYGFFPLMMTAFRKQPPPRPNVIQHDEQDLDIDFRGKMIISSGKLTYRIPSPTRPSRSLNKNSFQVSVGPTASESKRIIGKIIRNSNSF